MADKTRNRGRAASLSVAGPTSLAELDTKRGTNADIDTALALIHKRLDGIDELKASLQRVEEANVAYKDEIARVTKALEEANSSKAAEARQHRITRQELVIARATSDRMETQINDILNYQKIRNLRIDGIKEEQGENLKKIIVEIAGELGLTGMAYADIASVYRVGKPVQAGNRVRTIMITFMTERGRNAFFFARAQLKNNNKYRGVYVNDDVTPTTRRQRDSYRAVAAIAREDGADIRVHTDGIVINGQKHLLTDPTTLPEKYSVQKAKTIEVGGELYFASESSFLSNFSPSPIVDDDNTVYMTAEHMYQSLKCQHAQAHDKARAVQAAATPLGAKHIADTTGNTPEWRAVRDAAMERVVAAKFDQNPLLAHQLLETGDLKLNEATHNDHFGIGVTILGREIKDKSYRGSNKLGLMLMAKRASLRAAAAN